MRKIAILALGLVVLAAGCTSSPKIYSDYDPSGDFSRYKTYGFFDRVGTDNAQYSTLITQILKDAVKREMAVRGYYYDESNPDLEVNFFVHSDEKTRVSTVPTSSMYVDPWYGHYGYWGATRYETRVDQWTEGTLTIDLVDMQREQIVWEGSAVGRITEKALKAPREPINNAVTAIFADYPFTAPNR
ncbi:MAG: lipoprotein [Lysobacteraceae bacterium]|nr:MAG: lipoprotein [Xanthomonadaceae bacterium]